MLVAQTHLMLRSVQHMSEAMRRDLLFSHTILKKIDESGISKTKELPILIPLTLSQGLVPGFSRDTTFYYADSWQLSGAWKMFIDFILLLNWAQDLHSNCVFEWFRNVRALEDSWIRCLEAIFTVPLSGTLDLVSLIMFGELEEGVGRPFPFLHPSEGMPSPFS